MALATTGAQMERICRRFRSLREEHLREEGDGQDLRLGGLDGIDEGRGVQVRQLASGMVRLEITLAADEADLVLKAIEKARDELRAATTARMARMARMELQGVSAEAPASGPAGRSSDQRGHDTPLSRSPVPLPARADGLLSIVETSLRMPGVTGSVAMADPQSSGDLDLPLATLRSRWGSDRTCVLIHLSDSLLGPEGSQDAYLEDGTLLSSEAFRRLSCDAGLVPAVVKGDLPGTPGVLDVGRQSRAIPAALRRALWLRDGGCAFPGCANHRFVHGHHIGHWAHGGETALHNLVLLCTFHHRLLHEGGFHVHLDATSGAREWRDSRGRLVPKAPPSVFTEDEKPNILALGEMGVALPFDSEVNSCGWDGWPVDHAAVLDALISADPLFTSG